MLGDQALQKYISLNMASPSRGLYEFDFQNLSVTGKGQVLDFDVSESAPHLINLLRVE
jgi:hypothetical protein